MNDVHLALISLQIKILFYQLILIFLFLLILRSYTICEYHAKSMQDRDVQLQGMLFVCVSFSLCIFFIFNIKNIQHVTIGLNLTAVGPQGMLMACTSRDELFNFDPNYAQVSLQSAFNGRLVHQGLDVFANQFEQSKAQTFQFKEEPRVQILTIIFIFFVLCLFYVFVWATLIH